MSEQESVAKRLKAIIVLAFAKEMICDIDVIEDFWGGYYLRIVRDQFAQLLGEKVILYPKNWTEAFKERWFPKWLKKRFPVKFEKFDIAVFYPKYADKIAMKEEEHELGFIKKEKVFPEEKE